MAIIILAGLLLFISIINSSDSQIETNAGKDLSSPIVLVWEHAGVESEYGSIGPLGPVQVVSPTWFHLDDNFGHIRSDFDKDYLEWARSRGYQVWALVTNSFDPEITATVLGNEKLRLQVAEELVGLALQHELEGLNIDFENFHSDYRDHFTRFMAELAELCREENLILSVDVSMPSGSEYWSLGYDRIALAREADYIILMAYDEHWESSPTAGSVASLPWVERGLQLVLKDVPPDKLILGVPFYTRLFEIDESAERAVVLNSWSYSMQKADQIIAENNALVSFDIQAGQYLATYEKGGLYYKMWLEDTTSMQQRLELVTKYDLAGVAAWRRGLEKPEIWDLFDAYLYDDQE